MKVKMFRGIQFLSLLIDNVEILVDDWSAVKYRFGKDRI